MMASRSQLDAGRAWWWWCVVLLAPAIAGCATTAAGGRTDVSAGVGQRMIVPERTTRYALADHEAFVFPQVMASDSPEFPEDFHPPSPFAATVCASVVVGEDGSLRNVQLVEASECMAPGEVPAPLATAVREAMQAWKFGPAMLCEYPDAATRQSSWNGNGCSGPVREARPVPVTLTWAFTFELRDGRPQVTATRTGGG
ncbi:energy transducer TonB [Pseudoxanthomonas suwonensis]